MSIDYAAEYNNRARIANADEILGRIARGAVAYRAQALARRPDDLNLRYGTTPRQIIDLFRADAGANAPLAVFIHGGFWRSLDPTHFSAAAKGLNGRGIDVALAGYDLCPQVTIGQIVDEMRAACLYLWKRFAKRLLVFGHSAGGHLAAALFATDWQKLGAPADLVPAATGISGVYELAPLIHTPMNEDFRLDEAEARRQSPLYWTPPAGRPFDVIVGATRIERVSAPEPHPCGRLGQGRRAHPLRGAGGREPFLRDRTARRSGQRRWWNGWWRSPGRPR